MLEFRVYRDEATSLFKSLETRFKDYRTLKFVFGLAVDDQYLVKVEGGDIECIFVKFFMDGWSTCRGNVQPK